MILIDGDVLVHQVVNAVSRWELFDDTWIHACNRDELVYTLDAQIQDWMLQAGGEECVVALSDLEDNWRFREFETYKNKRRDSVRTPMFLAAREHLVSAYDTMEEPALEADDLLGLAATCPLVEDPVIVSIDKDLRSVPCRLFNPQREAEGVVTVTVREADLMHMHQTLVGDRVDEYPGCPGLGEVRAERLLAGLEPDEWWPAVVAAYEKKGLDEKYALSQARCARILRAGEYDWASREVIPWSP